MIITRCPHRVSLLGGTTDLVNYLKKERGKVLSFAINKYMYIMINKRLDNKIKLRYFANELVDNADELKHDIARYCLKKLDIKGVEIVSVSDVPANCGLSSSSSFACALLMALYEFKNIKKTSKEIADEVCEIELKLNHTTGRQDAYGCAIGGIKFIEFIYNEGVNIFPFKLSNTLQKEVFENNIRICFLKTRASESAYSVLKTYKDESNSIKKIKEYCDTAETYYQQFIFTDAFNEISLLFAKTWEEKKKLSNLISDEETDKILDYYQEKGWYGKVGGAGSGGFLVLLNKEVQVEDPPLPPTDLQELRYKIDTEGVKVLYNDN